MNKLQINNGILYVSDPLSKKSVCLSVKPGTYSTSFEKSNSRFISISIQHDESVSINGIDEKIYSEQVEVDNGLCGFSNFKPDLTEKEITDFIDKYSSTDIISNDNLFATESGFGNGEYEIYYKMNYNKEIVEVKVIFINLSNDSIWEDEYDCEEEE